VAFTRQQIRESIERAGDDHWDALVHHHTDVYPASNPTPGDVARAATGARNDAAEGPPAKGADPPVKTPPSRAASQ